MKATREEWNEFVKDTRDYGEFSEVLVQAVEDFFFSKMSAREEELYKLAEEMKRECACRVLVTSCAEKHTFNSALSQVQSLLQVKSSLP